LVSSIDVPDETRFEEKAREADATEAEEGGPEDTPNGSATAVAPRMDPEVEARRRSALAHVRTFGDPALRTRAAEVDTFDAALQSEIARMDQVMADALGVGLAATQLGIMHRVLVYRPGPHAPLVALVNPVVEWASEEDEIAEEGCLSLPGVIVDVERAVHVRVRARDEVGDDLLVEASGLDARVIQHEVDHLDGVLILERTSKEQRKEALRRLREGPDDSAGEPASLAEVSQG
jgi:peptide deformylase